MYVSPLSPSSVPLLSLTQIKLDNLTGTITYRAKRTKSPLFLVSHQLKTEKLKTLAEKFELKSGNIKAPTVFLFYFCGLALVEDSRSA
jgi:hypothetical protein